jgi:myosin heavy subunit
MKKNLKNWFHKKEKTAASEETTNPQDGYTAMNSNSLYNLPAPELVGIIFKFDLEVKNLNKELASAKETLGSMKTELPKVQEESLLYKQHNENLQSECNKLASDLNEAVTALDSKQAQYDLLKSQLESRDQLILSYKSQIQDLEKQVLDLQITGLTFDAGEEIIKLKKSLEESSKHTAEINELKIQNKIQENEINKMSAMITENKEQIRMWREKTNAFEHARTEVETELFKKKSEVEGLVQEITKLNFLKESSDTEIRALKENSNQKDIKFHKKILKLEALQAQNIELQQKYSVLKYELDSSRIKFQEDLIASQERSKQEKEACENVFTLKIQELEQEIQSISKIKSDHMSLESELSKLQKINKDQQDTLSNTLTELHQKTVKINSLELENAKISENLVKSNKKRELARSEIIKLNQKLEQYSSQKSNQSILEPILKLSAKPKEVSILTALKPELDSTYKSLMNMISSNDQTHYSIKIEDFTAFEKRFNNIVMTLHEQIDEISQNQSTSLKVPNLVNKSIGRNPIKLFSCISDQDEAPRLIPKPKKPTPVVDDRLVYRRGSAN